MTCQFCKTSLTQPGANTCARCFEYLDLTTGLPDLELARKREEEADTRRRENLSVQHATTPERTI